MGHTKPENLADLKNELSEIRKLEGLKEKSLGIFYYKAIRFLHFHDSEGERWADVKIDGAWTSYAVSFDAPKPQKVKFLKAVCRAHAKLALSSPKK